MRTIVKVLRETSPRPPLCARLGISVQYASNITKGQPIGGTETLARISAELGLDDAEIGASVREMYHDVFVSRDVAGSDHAPDGESAMPESQESEHGHAA